MRHVFANRITFLIAMLLVLAAVLFAYVRSAEIVIVPEEQLGDDVGQDEPIEGLAGFELETLGDDVYSHNVRDAMAVTGPVKKSSIPRSVATPQICSSQTVGVPL